MIAACEYVELRCRSAFSFLDGASLPEELVGRAAALGLRALAVADRDGLYAAPRLHGAAGRLAKDGAPEGAARHDQAALAAFAARWPLRPIHGAVLTLDQEWAQSR